MTVLLAGTAAVAFMMLPVEAASAASKNKYAGPAKSETSQANVHTESTVYDGWTVLCQEKAGAPKPVCVAQMRVVEPGKKTIVVFWQIARAADGGMTSLIQTPTGVQVQKGVEIKLDEGQPRKYDFSSCVPQNCEAVTTLDEAMIKDIKGATTVVFTVASKDGRQVSFKAPLKGVDKALDALNSKS
jgi:invasion protein IalB